MPFATIKPHEMLNIARLILLLAVLTSAGVPSILEYWHHDDAHHHHAEETSECSDTQCDCGCVGHSGTSAVIETHGFDFLFAINLTEENYSSFVLDIAPEQPDRPPRLFS